MKLSVLDNNSAIHAAIGRTVSFLRKSGQPVSIDNILVHLRQQESEALDGMKETYTSAVRALTAREQ